MSSTWPYRSALDDEGIECEVVSQTGAKDQGHSKYFTGSACSRGHVSLRYTSNRHCVKCAAEDNTSDSKRQYNRSEAGRSGERNRRARRGYVENAARDIVNGAISRGGRLPEKVSYTEAASQFRPLVQERSRLRNETGRAHEIAWLVQPEAHGLISPSNAEIRPSIFAKGNRPGPRSRAEARLERGEIGLADWEHLTRTERSVVLDGAEALAIQKGRDFDITAWDLHSGPPTESPAIERRKDK